MSRAVHEFVARRHRYADGAVYNTSRYDLMLNIGTEAAPYYRAFGGMIILRNKAIAYVGATSISAKVKDVVNHADHYVWGDNAQDALAKIKPFLNDAATAHRNRIS
jgi:hypothetical protein